MLPLPPAAHHPERDITCDLAGAFSIRTPVTHAHTSGYAITFDGSSDWAAGLVGSAWQRQFGSATAVGGAVAAMAATYADLLGPEPRHTRLTLYTDHEAATELNGRRFHQVDDMADPGAVNQQLLVLCHRNTRIVHDPDHPLVAAAREKAEAAAARTDSGLTPDDIGPDGAFHLGGSWDHGGTQWMVVYADASVTRHGVRVGWHAGTEGIYSADRPGWEPSVSRSEVLNVVEILEGWPHHSHQPLIVTDHAGTVRLAGYDSFWAGRTYPRTRPEEDRPLVRRLRDAIEATGAVLIRQPGHAGHAGMSLAHQLAVGSLFAGAPTPGGWGEDPAGWFKARDSRPAAKKVGPPPGRGRWSQLWAAQ